jgi:hypothetical protein
LLDTLPLLVGLLLLLLCALALFLGTLARAVLALVQAPGGIAARLRLPLPQLPVGLGARLNLPLAVLPLGCSPLASRARLAHARLLAHRWRTSHRRRLAARR